MAIQAVYLLDADPDLADALDDAARREAHPYAVATVEEVPKGPWDPQQNPVGPNDAVALLVLDGLMARELRLGDRSATELLGAGDLLRPWQDDEGRPGVRVHWSVLDPLRVAVINPRLLLVAARWPALADALLQRAFRRSRALAFNLAMTQIVGIDRRLLVLFWDAANRWGRVTPDGVKVRLPVTQQMLGQIVGARRPSVSLALGDLAERGELVRNGTDWLLRGAPPVLEEDSSVA